MKDPRITPHTESVLRAMLGQGADGERRRVVLAEGLYGLELSRLTDLPNGTLFPLLERLRQAGWVERYWEPDDLTEAEGRPRRRYYRLTDKGAERAPTAVAQVSLARGATAPHGALRPAAGHR
jgi:DNA-binding MarR family transcriptional regulator